MKTNSHDPYAPFRIRQYRHYAGGSLVALLGMRIQSVAVGWEVYQRTGEPLALGFVGLVQAIPTILLALPAGYIADRFDRRRVLSLSLAGMALGSLGLALVSYLRGPILLLYALLFFDATALSLGRPARMSMLPQLVPRKIFAGAVTWNTSLFQIASVLGPAVAGFVIAAHVPAAYLLSGACSIAFIVLLMRVRLSPGEPEVAAVSREALLAGLRFIGRARVILAAITLDMFAVLFGGAVYLLPVYAQDILHAGAQGYGWLNAAPAAGAFGMALLLAHRPPMQRAGRNLLAAVAGFGLVTIVFGFSRSFWLSLLMLFVGGALDNVSVVIRHTLIQLLTPDRMRGRVSAVNSVFIGASNELGGLESGVVAHFFGPVASVVSGGIGTLAVVATTALAAPGLRRVKRLHEPEPVPEDAAAPAPASTRPA